MAEENSDVVATLRPMMCPIFWRVLIITFLFNFEAAVAVVDSNNVQTNESYVQALTQNWELKINDEKAVFAFVFNSLPDRVRVYPTENYYYFKFFSHGAPFSGNFLFEPGIRDQGKLHFAYAMDSEQWQTSAEMFHILVGREDGVNIDKIGPLIYRVTHGSKSVVFELNDLSHVVPTVGLLTSDERLIGPIFDESAERFFLVYNFKLRLFLYLLDEGAPPTDVLLPSSVSERILIGRRTGFAFYRDNKVDRKILIGVYSGNIQANSYFDGPFDQLPDNFIEGESLRKAILEIEPRLKGEIDRFGSFPGDEDRYAITPYLFYVEQEELKVIDQCAARKIHSKLYYTCFLK